jgi:hypothetical protein
MHITEIITILTDVIANPSDIMLREHDNTVEEGMQRFCGSVPFEDHHGDQEVFGSHEGMFYSILSDSKLRFTYVEVVTPVV